MARIDDVSVRSEGSAIVVGGSDLPILDPECNLTPPLMIRRFALAVCSLLGLRPLGLQITLRSSPSHLEIRARGSGFPLVARATQSRLGLRPRGSRYALVAWASPSRFRPPSRVWSSPSRLGLCPRSSGYPLVALASRAKRSRLGLRPRGSRYALAAWACLGFAIAARASFATRTTRSPFGSLPARATRLRLGLCSHYLLADWALAARASRWEAA
jgi:hypothetical protein